MGTGGSIESMTLDGRTFSVAGDADVARKLGGSENEVQANGDGTARLLKTRVPWSLADITVSIDDEDGDHEFLQNLADGNAFFAVTLAYASGEVWQGDGQITGEVVANSAATTAAINLMGSGELTRQ